MKNKVRSERNEVKRRIKWTWMKERMINIGKESYELKENI